ncbi:uncharacterized protein LOC134060398 isoform X2 [Sardina pilchardus]
MKQSVGEEPVSIASYYSPNTNFYNGFDKSGRFKLEGGANSFNLTISQTQTTDSATYYCGSIFYADVTFGKGTVVFVKDRDSGDHAVIEQLDSVSPPSGGNVTLSCSVHAGSCEEEPAVFWFRPASADSRPGVAYSSRDNSCEYRLSRRNLSRADAHTHYCAVAACGRIVFGNGTRVHVQDDSSAPIPQLLAVSSLASALLMSLVVNVAFCVRARRSASQSGVSLCATCNAVVSAPGGAAAGRGQWEDGGVNYATVQLTAVQRDAQRRQNHTHTHTHSTPYSTTRHTQNNTHTHTHSSPYSTTRHTQNNTHTHTHSTPYSTTRHTQNNTHAHGTHSTPYSTTRDTQNHTHTHRTNCTPHSATRQGRHTPNHTHPHTQNHTHPHTQNPIYTPIHYQNRK